VLLFADPKTADGAARMEAIASMSDGFELAERDLALRGEGEVLGDRQSGLPGLRLASLARDQRLLEDSRADAKRIVEADPHLTAPEHVLLREDALERVGSVWDWVSSG
jgi:ATP-dependent DNA helicase RecG